MAESHYGKNVGGYPTTYRSRGTSSVASTTSVNDRGSGGGKDQASDLQTWVPPAKRVVVVVGSFSKGTPKEHIIRTIREATQENEGSRMAQRMSAPLYSQCSADSNSATLSTCGSFWKSVLARQEHV